MRSFVAFALLVAGPHLFAEVYTPERIRDLVIQTSRALICGQRPDGLWGDPPGVIRVSVADPPPVEGDPPRPPRPVEDQYRVFAVRQCQAAEALWLVQDQVPAAAESASRAQDLAAKALLADPSRPISLTEAIWFLRAERACTQSVGGTVASEGPRTVAAKLCQEVLQRAMKRNTYGENCLGLGLSTGDFDIDLRQTWLAQGLSPCSYLLWNPTGAANQPVPARVARHQHWSPVVLTDMEQVIRAASPFEDGTAYSVALYGKVDDAKLEWLRPSCEVAVGALDPEFALACMSIFARRRDPVDVWWRGCRAKWTEQLLATCQRGMTPQGAALVWRIPKAEIFEHSQSLALRWCVALAQTVAPDPATVPCIDFKRFKKERCDPAAKRLVREQRTDGSWECSSADDATGLAYLALLGQGLDPHYPGNPFRGEMRRTKALLLASDVKALSTLALAQRVAALSELSAFDQDQAIRGRLAVQVAELRSRALPAGGWPAVNGGKEIDWFTTSMACMAGANGGIHGIKLFDPGESAWWSNRAGDIVPTDSVLCWKVLSGLFVKELSVERRRQSIDVLCAADCSGGWQERYAITRIMLRSGQMNWPWLNKAIQDQSARITPVEQAWGLMFDSMVAAMLPIE